MKKENIIILAGLVVLIVLVGFAFQSSNSAKQAGKEVGKLNAIIQERDAQIVKFAEEIKAKEDELSGIKIELDNTSKALNEAVAKINQQPVQQPAVIEAPQAEPQATPQAVSQAAQQ